MPDALVLVAEEAAKIHILRPSLRTIGTHTQTHTTHKAAKCVERFLLKGQYAGGEKFAQESPRDLSTTHLFILSCQVPIAAATAAAVLKLQEKGAADRQVARMAAVAAAEEAAATASVQNSSSSSSSSSGGGGGGGSGDGEWELVLGMCGQINGTTWKVVAR